jgi:hypothetical protein
LGFGSTILRSLTPRALGGVAELRFNVEGLVWTLKAPTKVSGGVLDDWETPLEEPSV